MSIANLWRGVGAASVYVMMAVVTIAECHPASERYIPIGQSPGISGKYSYTGTIVALNDVEQTIIVAESGQQIVVEINATTKIWLDRSKGRKINLRGDYHDCQVGRNVEIKFVDADTMQIAEWVKVEVDT